MMSDYKLFDTIYCALLEFTRSLFQWILGQFYLEYLHGTLGTFLQKRERHGLEIITLQASKSIEI